MANPNWRDFIAPGANVPYRAGNVPEQEQMAAPVSEASGKIVPSGDTSGLYAIYGRKNPHAASADRYSRMSGMDMGGRLGQLPGIAATFMAGRAEKKSAEFEQDKQKQIDDFMARKEEHDRIQNDWEAKKRGVEIFQKEVIPMMEQAWDQKYAETKDPEVAGKYAASVGNDESTKSKLGTPLLLSYGKWQDGTRTTIWRGSTGEISQGVVNAKGELGVLIKKGDKVVTVPADDKDMIFGDYVKLQDARNKETDTATRQLRAGTAGLKGREHGYLTAAGELFYSTDPDEAMKRGAVKVRSDVTRDGFKETVEDWLPGKAPAEAPEQPAPQAAPQGPGPLQRAAGAVAEQLRPSGGGMAGAVGRFVGGQPQATAPQQAQPAQGLIRRASGGRIALFDPNTKEFVRWE